MFVPIFPPAWSPESLRRATGGREIDVARATLLAITVAGVQDEPLPAGAKLDVRTLEVDVRDLAYRTEEIEGRSTSTERRSARRPSRPSSR